MTWPLFACSRRILGSALLVMMYVDQATVGEERGIPSNKTATDGIEQVQRETDERRAIEEALDRAVKTGAYVELDAALDNSDEMTRWYVLRLLPKIPVEERKTLMLSALMKPRLWPSERQWFSIFAPHGVYAGNQDMFRVMLRETFGIEVKYEVPWTVEERRALANKLSPGYAAAAESREHPAGPEAPVSSSAGTSAGVSSAPLVDARSNPKDSSSDTGRPCRWPVVGAAGILLAVVWTLLRAARMRKRE